MARKKAEQKIVRVSEIPPEVLGAVIAADLAQIIADAKTHQDPDASRRILFAAGRLQEIAEADLTQVTVEKMMAVNSVLNE